MVVLSAILSILGGLCGVMGILVATEVFDLTTAGINEYIFWFGLAGILFLASITTALTRGE